MRNFDSMTAKFGMTKLTNGVLYNAKVHPERYMSSPMHGKIIAEQLNCNFDQILYFGNPCALSSSQTWTDIIMTYRIEAIFRTMVHHFTRFQLL